MTYNNKIAISWDDIKVDSIALAGKIKTQNNKIPERILAVTRGGLIPAGLVARALDISVIETIGLASYDGQTQTGIIRELKKADTAFLRDTLIIDDLVDTGATFAYLRPRTENCVFATLYAKPSGQPTTDFFVRAFDQDCWIDFPWEV